VVKTLRVSEYTVTCDTCGRTDCTNSWDSGDYKGALSYFRSVGWRVGKANVCEDCICQRAEDARAWLGMGGGEEA